jgi:phospholipid transport system transporter-binding protein
MRNMPATSRAVLKAGQNPGDFILAGVLDFDSVPMLLKQGFTWLQQQPVCVDLSQVEHSNSAGIGLLLEWLRQAHKSNTGIRYLNIPPSLQAVARICGVSDWLTAAARKS